MNSPLREKQLYRRPEKGMIKGVCAGVAEYLSIPVLLVRIMVVLSVLCGLFFLTILLYLALVLFLPVAPIDKQAQTQRQSSQQQFTQVTRELQLCEQRLRRLERYLTSESFKLERRFRQLG